MRQVVVIKFCREGNYYYKRISFGKAFQLPLFENNPSFSEISFPLLFGWAFYLQCGSGDSICDFRRGAEMTWFGKFSLHFFWRGNSWETEEKHCLIFTNPPCFLTHKGTIIVSLRFCHLRGLENLMQVLRARPPTTFSQKPYSLCRPS